MELQFIMLNKASQTQRNEYDVSHFIGDIYQKKTWKQKGDF